MITKHNEIAERVLNQIEPNGELLTTDQAIKAMEAYSNIVNATIIRKVEQLQSEATVNLKTIEAMENENKELIDGLKLIRNRIKLAPKGILPESKFIINQLLERYKH